MCEMAALAKRAQVGGIVVGHVMIEMSAGDHDVDVAGWDLGWETLGRWKVGAGPPPLLVTPALSLVIVPTAIGQLANEPLVRTLALFTAAIGAAEADRGRKLFPVDGIEASHLRFNRHEAIRSWNRTVVRWGFERESNGWWTPRPSKKLGFVENPRQRSSSEWAWTAQGLGSDAPRARPKGASLPFFAFCGPLKS